MAGPGAEQDEHTASWPRLRQVHVGQVDPGIGHAPEAGGGRTGLLDLQSRGEQSKDGGQE